jgi:hypothetical protein
MIAGCCPANEEKFNGDGRYPNITCFPDPSSVVVCTDDAWNRRNAGLTGPMPPVSDGVGVGVGTIVVGTGVVGITAGDMPMTAE